MVSPVTKIPKNDRIDFNLDTFEREGGADGVFTAVVAGRRIEMLDPVDIDWQDLNRLDSPDEFLEFCFSAPDKKFFMAQKIKAWQLNAMMDRYMAFYNLGDKGK